MTTNEFVPNPDFHPIDTEEQVTTSQVSDQITEAAAEPNEASSVVESVQDESIAEVEVDSENEAEEIDEVDDTDETEEESAEFDPAAYDEPALEDNVEESVFVARVNKYKKGSIEWIREEHEIVTEHLSHVQEDFDKFTRILKLENATVRSNKYMLKQKSEELKDLLDAQDSLNSWIAERQNTYAWQLLDALNKQRIRIVEFEAEVQAWCDKPTEELYEASLKHHKKFKRKLKWGIGGILLSFSIGAIVNIILGFFGIDWIFKILSLVMSLIGIGNPFAAVPSIIGGLSVFTWITALTTYFRSYLKFRRQLEEQVLEARFYLRAVKELSSQKGKISALHAQVQDYLVFMAEVLHKPWNVDQKWLTYETSTINSETLPASLVVAKPLETGVYREVTKHAIEEFTSKNWRTHQLETLFAEYEKLYLMSTNSLESRVNSDPIIREKIKSDLETSEILTLVGDSMVLNLAKHLQKSVLPKELGFYVGSIKPDALASLDLSSGIFSDEEQELNWHNFVTSILGQASAWSNLAYSIRGLEDKLAQSNSIRSFALIPDRLRQDVLKPVEAVPVKKDENSGVEVVIRVDVSSWLDPEKVALLNAASTPRPSQSVQPVTDIYRPDVTIRG
jgi:uncharacterized membrane protein YuzA (DUF378 family)